MGIGIPGHGPAESGGPLTETLRRTGQVNGLFTMLAGLSG